MVELVRQDGFGFGKPAVFAPSPSSVRDGFSGEFRHALMQIVSVLQRQLSLGVK